MFSFHMVGENNLYEEFVCLNLGFGSAINFLHDLCKATVKSLSFNCLIPVKEMAWIRDDK